MVRKDLRDDMSVVQVLGVYLFSLPIFVASGGVWFLLELCKGVTEIFIMVLDMRS